MNDCLGIVVAHDSHLEWLEICQVRRAEFLLFEPGDKVRLLKYATDHDLKFSAHCPILKDPSHAENPLLATIIDSDSTRRDAALRLMFGSARTASDMGAEYMVVHLQRPENFGGPNSQGFDHAAALDVARRGLSSLCDISSRFDLPIYIENLMDNSSFYKPEHYAALLSTFPSIGFCLDIGHLALDLKNFGVPIDEIIDATLPHIRAVHLQNSNISLAPRIRRYWKIPVHPDQPPAEGWLDIPAILDKIIASCSGVAINLEGRPDGEFDIDYMREGALWCDSLISANLDAARDA